jgi:hypothetical protein
MKIEAAGYSETFVTLYQTIPRHILRGSNLQYQVSYITSGSTVCLCLGLAPQRTEDSIYGHDCSLQEITLLHRVLCALCNDTISS